MFRTISIRRIGAYSLFMIRNKANPVLKGLAVGDRGKKTAELYKALSAADLEKLKAEAAKIPTKSKSGGATKKAAKSGKRKASPYALFVKANYEKVSQLPFGERMAGLAKLWKAKKK